MAWVTQTFEMEGLKTSLEAKRVVLSLVSDDTTIRFVFEPVTQSEAHTHAMMLRRAARRLEEIGKGLQ